MLIKIIVLSFALNLINESNCWIFNEINNRAIEANLLVLENQTGMTPEDLSRLRFSLIYPGTKWCGPGDIAESYDDLGTEVETDICCREHDFCPDTIPAGESRYNLTNDAFYTRLNCSCDQRFRQCLHNGNTTASTTVGLLYFNIIGTQCFRRDYPVTGCVRRGGWLNSKCVEYSYDTSGEMTYQWFDAPNY